MAVIVRSAGEVDRVACLDLVSTLTSRPASPGWASAYDALLTGLRGAIQVAVEGEQVLGVVTVSYNLTIRYGGEYCTLEELIVDPATRGRNVGGMLVEAAVSAARQRGCAEMDLYLSARTEGNRPFYEKYGFQVVGSELRQAL